MLKNVIAFLLSVALAISAAAPALAAGSTYYQTYSFEPFEGNSPKSGTVYFPQEVINAAVVIQSFDADPFEVGDSEVISVAIQNVNIEANSVTFDVIMKTTDDSIPKNVEVAVIAEQF